jgi:hypothetical protein
MEEYLQMGVKPLIDAFPEVGKILERYGISCVSCDVGTCKLQEVVQFHALPPRDEAKMMSLIEEAIYSQEEIRS